MFDPNCSPRGLRRFRPPRSIVGQRWNIRQHHLGLANPLVVPYRPVVAPSSTKLKTRDLRNGFTYFHDVSDNGEVRRGSSGHRWPFPASMETSYGLKQPQKTSNLSISKKGRKRWKGISSIHRRYPTSDETQRTIRCVVVWGTNLWHQFGRKCCRKQRI